jgi:hypothetical protein
MKALRIKHYMKGGGDCAGASVASFLGLPTYDQDSAPIAALQTAYRDRSPTDPIIREWLVALGYDWVQYIIPEDKALPLHCPYEPVLCLACVTHPAFNEREGHLVVVSIHSVPLSEENEYQVNMNLVHDPNPEPPPWDEYTVESLYIVTPGVRDES